MQNLSFNENNDLIYMKTFFQPKPTESMQQNQPITHPLYGAAPINNGYNPEPPQIFHPPPSSNAYGQPPPSTNTYGQPPSNNFTPGAFNTNAVNFNHQQNFSQLPNQQFLQSPPAVETPQPIQKLPIPEEHLHMQTVFDELKVQCSCAANNPVGFWISKVLNVHNNNFVPI